MFRVKISAMLTLVILMVMTVVYFILPSVLERELGDDARQRLLLAASAVERDERLNDFSLVAKAEHIAAFSGLREALVDQYEEPYDYNRHLGVYNKGLLRWQYVFGDFKKNNEGEPPVAQPLIERPPHLPELFFVTDDKGIGVAALGQGKYEWYQANVAAAHPVLMSVADGRAREDLWIWSWNEGEQGEPHQIGIAPVMQGPERMVGVVVVGRSLNSAAAREVSQRAGNLPVAYFMEGRVIASTMDKAADEALGQQLLAAADADGQKIDITAPRQVSLGNERYLACARRFWRDASAGEAGFIVLVPLGPGLTMVGSIERGIVIVGLAILLLLLISALIVVRSFVKPFEELDQGIQEVLAGNKDYTFKVTGNYPFQTGMAQSLNLMSAFLQGKPMPDEEDEDTEGWGEFLIAEVSQTAMMRALGQDGKPIEPPVPRTQAPTEALDDYHRRLFDEYVTARRALNEDTSDLTLGAFVERLDRHAVALCRKHKAREVRFSVVVLDGKVVLKPQPIF